MEALSRHPGAFIRPSPSGSVLGGVADKTRETMLLCEAAGFDLILIETVGVGQSETVVRNMVDFFLLLLLPGGGDDLQGIKKGIVELADGLVITKADGDNLGRAKRTQSDFSHALHILNPGDKPIPKVLTSSAITGEGIAEVWSMIADFFRGISASGELKQLRQQQDLNWFDEQFNSLLRQRLTTSPQFKTRVSEFRELVINGSISPSAAARELLDSFKL
jgi:LAO/AO transport system kinase